LRTIDLDERLDHLFALPLEGFTKERDSLAKALRSEGREDDAAQVAGLRKPVLSAWVTNRLVHRHADEVHALAELQESLETASPDEMRAGIKRRRQLISGLTKKAAAILGEVGRSATSTVLQRVAQNLLDTSTPEERAALLRGRLSADLVGSGLGAWATQGADVETGSSPPDARAERARREAERLEEEARGAENEARELSALARAAGKRAEQARLDAETAQRKAERARARADVALESL
jgi:hypothetical protein